jgi:hypothetical protein
MEMLLPLVALTMASRIWGLLFWGFFVVVEIELMGEANRVLHASHDLHDFQAK